MANNKVRQRAADKAFEDYSFGDGVTVLDSDGWTDDDGNEWTKMVYVRFAADGANEDGRQVLFHAEFKNDKADKVARAYGMLISSGTEIGEQSVAAKQSFGRRK